MRAALPRGGMLADDLWEARHRTVLVVLWLHAAGIPVFALVRGYPLGHGLLDTAPIALLAASASLRHAAGRGTRSVLATIGLLLSSAVLVHLAGGATEMHFHFFVMLALISLYHDWMPFVVALLFVIAHHAVLGWFDTSAVFGRDHDNPLGWAAVHGVFVLGASAAQLVSWRITEQQHERSEAALRASEQRFRSLIEHSTDAVAVMAPDGTMTYESPSIRRVFGGSADKHDWDASPVVAEDRASVRAAARGLRPAEWAPFRARIVDRRGVLRWIEGRVTNMCHVSEIGGYLFNYRDVTDRYHDDLTGLPNRARFVEVHSGLPESAVLLVGIDNLKVVNDTDGREAGDSIVRTMAQRLRDVVGEDGFVARLGGDEFGVVVLTGIDDAFDIASHLVAVGRGTSVSCSVGVALGGHDAIADAELALHRAKQLGKERVEVFEDDLRRAIVERSALRTDLHRAIRAGELVPYYQPVVALGTGTVVGAEALVRWRHPERGVLPPAAFIDLAEETGMIVDIGRGVLARACADAVTWDPRLSVSVNLSPTQLLDGPLVRTVASVLDATGLAPSRLTLEITESVLVADPDLAASVLAELKALGVSIALDDFGTGYSSLGYLHRFPVDVLKIDKSFVEGDVSLLEAIVGLGQTLELRVVAEGIETTGQWLTLQSLGCELGQGYVFAAPMLVSEFLGFVSGVSTVV